MEKEKSKKARCACGGERNCVILWEHKQAQEDEHVSWCTMWYLLQCRGCDNIFVQTVSTNSLDYENFYDRNGDTGTDYTETVRHWPALSKRSRPEWFLDFGIDADNVADLYTAFLELYGALDNDLNTLAAIGIRTCFDIAAELLGVDPDLFFKTKLEKLVTLGHIGNGDRVRLQVLVDAGSASVHRGWRPTADDLDTMMDVLEHFVHDAFVSPARRKRLDEKVEKMSVAVPPRESRRTKPSTDL